MTESTLRHELPGLPMRALCVDVVQGPDAPKSVAAKGSVLTVGTAADNELVLTDQTVSRYHAEFSVRSQGIALHDPGSTNGTWVSGIRVAEGILPVGSLVTVGRTQLRISEGQPVDLPLFEGEKLGDLLGRAPAMRRLMADITLAARSDASVLVQGETGSGKELVARSLHTLSARSAGPLIIVDCGALSPTLVASELFGHERGSFTGATSQHIGAFERAHGGTLFLDEIGELPSTLQPALLGAIERKRFRRLGGKHDVALDVRVVSATHRDLRAEVNAGTFRPDLYYRLAALRLCVPPLRERSEDIAVLVQAFASAAGFSGPLHTLISEPVLAQLRQHRWPGNVRELRNLVETTLTLGERRAVEELAHAPHGDGDVDRIGARLPLRYREARAQLLEEFEQRYIEYWLRACDHNVSRMAREAGMDRSHLNDLVRKHTLRRDG